MYNIIVKSSTYNLIAKLLKLILNIIYFIKCLLCSRQYTSNLETAYLRMNSLQKDVKKQITSSQI